MSMDFTWDDVSEEEPKDELKMIGTLFGQKLYIDMTGCDPRIFDYAVRFHEEGLDNAEKLRKIRGIIETKI